MLLRTSLRYLLRHPWLLVLSLVGVALGVAVVVAIDVANASATRAFTRSAEVVAGRATHAVVGAGGTVEGSLYQRLRFAGVRESAPVAEGYATARGRVLNVLGLDPLADAPFRSLAGEGAGVDLGLFLATPGAAFLAPSAAARLALAPGDTLGLAVEGTRRTVRIGALLAPGEAGQDDALANLVVLDVAEAQAVLGLGSRLTRIDLALPEGEAGARRRAEIERLLPPGARIERSATRTESLETMTRAFRLNLTALSFLALVVGMFLVYNTTTFAVVQRRFLLGRLRALGVTRREVFGLVLGEAALVGAVGTAFGLALGVILGRGLVALVAGTISDLYFSVTVASVAITPWMLFKGAALGLGTTLAAAFAPAREAAGADVSAVLRRSETEARAGRRLPVLALAGVALLAAGAGVLAWPRLPLALAYGALLVVMLGFSLVVPAAVAGFARAVRPVASRAFGPLGRMAAGGLQAHLGRISVAVAALVVAIAATIGVGVMVASFRSTVVAWLEGALVADVFVQPPSLVARRGEASLRPDVVEALLRAPGVTSGYSIRALTTTSQFGRTDLIAASGGAAQERTFKIKEGRAADVWPRLRAGEAVFVSEPFAYRHGVGIGDTVRLGTERGVRPFPIAAVYYDYGSDMGLVLMHRSAFERLYSDRGTSGLALFAAPGVDPDALAEQLRARVADRQAVIVRSNRGLREFSLGIFDRTFAITGVLRLLALLVAFVGVVSAFMALQLERAREYATLRAMGLTPREVYGLVSIQTGLMGLVAGLLSLPLGLALAAVLIFVINRRSFGWTLQATVPPETLVTAVVLAVVAALLAGLYPAWKMAHARPAEALRDE